MSYPSPYLRVGRLAWTMLLLAFALLSAIPANAQTAPVLVGATSRKVHGAAGTFNLPLSLVLSNPTTEPRLGPLQTVVFTFDKAVVSGKADVIEGVAIVGTPSFSGSEMIVPLSGVVSLQYVTVAVSGVASGDGGTGGNGLVRIGYLPGDVTQNRVVALSDLGQVNAQIAQVVTGANFLKDVNSTGTLSLADKGLTNTQLTKALSVPGNPVTACGSAGCVVTPAGGFLNPTLTVPAGALSSTIGITMFDQTGDPSDASVFHVYSFGPAGTTFSVPATIDLPAPPLTVDQDAVIEVSDDGVTWVAITTTLSNGRVSGPIAHFSKCRTRAFIKGAGDLLIIDMVNYQELSNVKGTSGLVIPPAGEQGSCYSGDLFGICLKIQNPNNVPLTSSCPVPTPSPPPTGCKQLHVAPWQCYTRLTSFPAAFDPANPTAYEGEHCNISGLVIPCAESIYNLDQFLPVGGLPANTTIWVDLNFFVNSPPTANGVSPASCFGSSYIGMDVVVREPRGNCAPGGKCDWQAGIRSAKDGPHIAVPAGTQVFRPAGVAGCVPIAPATTCPSTCNPVAPATTCQVEWDWLVNHPGNYPTLRFAPAGNPLKNWVFGAQF